MGWWLVDFIRAWVGVNGWLAKRTKGDGRGPRTERWRDEVVASSNPGCETDVAFCVFEDVERSDMRLRMAFSALASQLPCNLDDAVLRRRLEIWMLNEVG